LFVPRVLRHDAEMACDRGLHALLIAAPLAAVLSATPVSAQSPAPLPKLSLEELMDIDVSITAREPSRIADAAAAVTVITRQEIRRSGATNLPEALRLAHGFFVGRFNNGTWVISPRGFNINTANKVLVMIDGRTVYTPLYGGVFWDAQLLSLEDIDRIEVVRGPAATLWGSNAVNGVINVVTRSAPDSQGLALSLWGGNEERAGVSARYGGQLSDTTSYRMFVRASGRDDARLASKAGSGDDWKGGTSGFRVDRTRATEQASLAGALYQAREGLQGREDIQMGGGHLQGVYRRDLGAWRFQTAAYYDRTRRMVPLQITETRHSMDVDGQLSRPIAQRHSLIVGGGYRHSTDQTVGTAVVAFDPADRSTNLSNVFGSFDVALGHGVVATTGLKAEHNSYTGWEWQPTVRARWKATDTQTLWAATSRAVRIPTRFDRDLRIPGTGPVVLRGDEGFASENVWAYEGGYRARPTSRFSVDVTAFRNRYDDLRSQELPGAPGQPVILGNGYEGRSAGVEVLSNLQPSDAVRFVVGYSWLDLDLEPVPGSRDRTGGIFEANDPTHQFQLRWYGDLTRRLELDGAVRYVSELPQPTLKAYTEMSVRVGWRFTPTLDLSILGRDLLHDQHPEFSSPTSAQLIYFERSVVIRLTRGF